MLDVGMSYKCYLHTNKSGSRNKSKIMVDVVAEVGSVDSDVM